jgi:uncharacterized protein (DUF305 family)
LTETTPSPGGKRRLVGYVLGGILLLGVGVSAGFVLAPKPAQTPSTSSAEAGFARDMQTHHDQAVEMAMIEYGKTDDSELKTLAYDIATSQSQQAGQMYGWLETWNLSQASTDPAMTWMSLPTLANGSAHGQDMDMSSSSPASVAPTTVGSMPGLATAAQLAQLRSDDGDAADELFLQLMIAHHQGGIDMAKGLLARSDNAVAVSLARGTILVQQGDINYMKDLLAKY